MTEKKTEKAKKKAKKKDIVGKRDIVLIYDVENGNPNGDPLNDNFPRTTQDGVYGIVSGEALKHKINTVHSLVHQNEDGQYVLLREDNPNTMHEVEERYFEKEGKKEIFKLDDLLEDHFDRRAFGQVCTAKKSHNSCRGAVMMYPAKSVHPVVAEEIQITKCVATKKKDKILQKEGEESETETGKMGTKKSLDYGMYKGIASVSPFQARKNGFSEDDYRYLVEDMRLMFEMNRSAGSGVQTLRKLVVFVHSTDIGDVSTAKLRDSVKVTFKEDADSVHSFEDIESITIDKTEIPDSVKIEVIEVL